MRIGGTQLAFTWIGCFLGAGFVSGQEIHQFFTHFGAWGTLGLLISILLLSTLCGLVFQIAKTTGFQELHRIVVPWENEKVRGLVGVIAVTFMFGIYVVMAAGAGTLLEQLFGYPALRLLGGAIFCAVVTLVAIRGMGGAVKVFGTIIPILVVLSLIVVGAGLFVFGQNGLHFEASATRNPVVNHWLFSAVTFVSYNFLCSIGTLAALGTMAGSKRGIRKGTILGGILLLLISMGIHTVMTALPSCAQAELPMLYLAGELSRVLELAYAVVILLGMFGASMSVFVPVPQYFSRFPICKRHPVLLPVVLSVAAFALSRVGFSSLIGTMFPMYGFVGFLFVAGVLCHAWKLRKKTSRVEQSAGL